jgi:hypothetical protein
MCVLGEKFSESRLRLNAIEERQGGTFGAQHPSKNLKNDPDPSDQFGSQAVSGKP